ncbi:MAG: transcriptional regulator [Erysipelotrichaceae bacterium]
MNTSQLCQLIQAEQRNRIEEESFVRVVFASDLMSDVLYLSNCNNETTLLVTGLANQQTINTAHMLDIKVIVFVRGKVLPDEIVALASEHGIVCLTTPKSMYETCGLLWSSGLAEVKFDVSDNL